MEGSLVIGAGTLALFVLELVKWVLRKFVLKDPAFEFAPIFYELLVPFLTAGAGWLLGFIGWAAPIALDPKVLLQWAVAILIELAAYHMGVKPFKEYRAARAA